MSGEQSVHSDEASNFRKLLEKSSPNSTFSFRSELLSDLDSHKGRRTKSHRRHHSRRDKDRDANGTMLDTRHLSRLLAYDEVEAVEMRKVLVQTAERLEQESRRATEAEARAREAEARVLALHAARQTAQSEALREQEALKAYQAQVEMARNEILRAQKELDNMAADRQRAEEEAARERSKARAMAKEMEIQQALEKGRQEGKTQGFVDGRKEGWRLGTQQGMKEAYRDMFRYDDADSIVSRSTSTPPLTSGGQQPPDTSFASTATRSATPAYVPPAAPPPAPVNFPAPVTVTSKNARATSTRTATPSATHKRSGSLAQSIKSRLRVNSDPQPAPVPSVAPVVSSVPVVPTVATTGRQEEAARVSPGRLTPKVSRERISSPIPIAIQNRSPSPRHSPTSPLPGGYIPLQENGRVSLPPPHELDPPPPSPHTPAAPLPPELAYMPPGTSLQPPGGTVNVAPTITVQEPTPPEPPITMPEPQPAPPPVSRKSAAESNVRPSKVLARDYAFSARGESPPLPPIPTAERSSKGKQRQRMGPPRAGAGLHAPGRSSPSDTSTEFSQFDIVEQPERVRSLGMGRGNGSQLSVIMEGGSTAAESPEPMHRRATPQMANIGSMRGPTTSGPPPVAGQGIIHDPREYGDIADVPLTPTELAHRRMVAEQLRWSPIQNEVRHGVRGTRDDVSIKSSTTRASAPRRRPNVKMPERLGPSKEVETLEKHAEMYDAFGTDRGFPTFDSQSSPDDVAVSTRTPEFKRGHRRAMSSSTTVPEITIQPPSRPSSKGSKVSIAGNRLSPERESVPIPAPATPSRRHSMQGPPMTPSRVPLPQTSGQMPLSLGTPHSADLGLPPGFVPMQGPPEVMETFSSAGAPKTPRMAAPTFSSRTPVMSANTLSSQGGPAKFQGRTPSGVPLPLSTATTTRGLPDYASLASRGTGRSVHQELPRVAATTNEPATVPFNYPAGFTPARIPLPKSVAGSPRNSTSHQTPVWGGNSWAAGATPGPSMPPMLGGGDRPMSIYAGDGVNKKVSSTSLASSYKKFNPSTYLDPAYLASTDSISRIDPTIEDRARARTPSRAGSVHSTNTDRSERKALYAASVETVTDEDEA